MPAKPTGTRPTTVRPDRRGQPRQVPLPDFGAVALGPHPQQTMRVLGLVRAGHPWKYILDVGRYQKSWTEADVRRILRANRIALADQPAEAHRAPVQAAPLLLHRRHLSVLDGVCKGWTNAEIGAYHGIPESTVKVAVRSITKKAGVRDRVGLVVAVLTGQLAPAEEGDHDA